VGLATAMALSAWLNAGLLYLGLRRAGGNGNGGAFGLRGGGSASGQQTD